MTEAIRNGTGPSARDRATGGEGNRRPMAPWPGLAAWGREIALPSGTRLFVYDTGASAGTPVVLVHGLGDDADTWRHVFPPLAPASRVVAFDLPGFGRSGKPARAYTVPFFQDVLLELLETLGLARVVLAGHSLGAIISHAMALRRPERAERLVLLDGSLLARTQPLNLTTLLFLVPGLGEWLYNRLRREPQAAYRSLRPYYYALDALPEADRRFLFQRVNERVWDDEQRRAFLSTLRNLARWIPGQQRDLPARLAAFNVPTLVLWGENDTLNPIANGSTLAEVQPGARLVRVPRAGHNVQQERPEAVVAAILENLPSPRS